MVQFYPVYTIGYAVGSANYPEDICPVDNLRRLVKYKRFILNVKSKSNRVVLTIAALTVVARALYFLAKQRLLAAGSTGP
ncbi:MAG: hypothetical protein Q7U57_10645 [Methylovulum sp.]|nr:hypothetical protein [Methylovulum sp.]